MYEFFLVQSAVYTPRVILECGKFFNVHTSLKHFFLILQVLDIMKERAKTEPAYGHLPTGLQGLDGALWGGIPFGIVTEVVGPAGIGKTQV